MKFKSLLFVLCFGLFSQTFAANIHLHPSMEVAKKQNQPTQNYYPERCVIKIVNNSGTNVHVTGVFTDGSAIGFEIYRNDPPHFIDLYYHGYCHDGMTLTIRSPYDGIIYSDWTEVGSVIRINPYMLNSTSQIKVDVAKK